MKYLLIVALSGVAFWLGIAYEMANRPPPVTYIVKSDAPRCDLIDRITKRKGAHL